MNIKKAVVRYPVLAMMLGLWMGFAMNVRAAPADIGPLPALKYDKVKAELGKRLFFDKRLSGDAGIACSGCHMPEHGFAHPDALSPGYPGNKHFRNSPSLINTAYKKIWLHDGRIATGLDDVLREMITESYIMNMDMRIMQERVKQDPVYVQMFKDAGYGEPDHGRVRKAIVEYLKTLVSRGAPFDSGKMSASAKRGEKLFRGKAGCIQCHNGPNFTDGKRHNTGVPENFDVFMDPARHQAFLAYAAFHGVSGHMNLKRDPGAHVQTHFANHTDYGTFITPSLRELKYTAPYMHNGMLKTLKDVVAYYNRGGDNDRNKDALIKPLRLGKNEQQDLVAFLESLSGAPFTGDRFIWSKPYPGEYAVIPNWSETRN